MKRETFTTKTGQRVTEAVVLQTEVSRPTDSFVVNWARNQYGWRTAKRVVQLLLDGHAVAVARYGFTVDGEWRPLSGGTASLFDAVPPRTGPSAGAIAAKAAIDAMSPRVRQALGRRIDAGSCPDCGARSERRGHQTCQYPSDR